MPQLATSRILERLAEIPPLWLAVWAGLAVLSVALFVLMQTRWGQARPMRKCAVLSLFAHALLICFAMSINIVHGPADGPVHPSIRVAIVDGNWEPTDPAEIEEADIETKPWDPQATGPVVAPDVTQLEPPTLKPPPLTDPPDVPPPEAPPSTEPNIADDSTTKAETSDLEPPPLAETELNAAPPATAMETTPSEAVDQSPPPEPTSPELPVPTDPSEQTPQSPERPVVGTGAPFAPGEFNDVQPPSPTPARPAATTPKGVYRHRTTTAKREIAQQSGGSGETEAAVDDALAWLARAQAPNGRWPAAEHGGGRELVVLGHDRRGAGIRADTGVTGLALLAFLGAGHTHRYGDHQATVAAGIAYLVDAQGHDGNLAGAATPFARTYCHAMATFALAEAFAMTGDRALEKPAARAVGYCVRTQHRGSGGWRYHVADPGDTSQLGWQVMALRSAERAGIAVPNETWNGVLHFLRSVASGRSGGLAGYRPSAPPRRTMTAEAAYCRRLAASRLAAGPGSIETSRPGGEAAAFLLTELPGDGRPNLYYWYYATLFLHDRAVGNAPNKSRIPRDANRQSDWLRWNDALKRTLVAKQQARGRHAGSWSPDTVWGGYGGRVYSTAMAALCLEVYYRYAGKDDRSATAEPTEWSSKR